MAAFLLNVAPLFHQVLTSEILHKTVAGFSLPFILGCVHAIYGVPQMFVSPSHAKKKISYL